MQPHSMCALGMAGYVWANWNTTCPPSASMKVTYQKDGQYKTNVYYLSNMKEEDQRRKLRIDITRAGSGDIACTITVTRRTPEISEEVEMTHSQQHISGLREVARINKDDISDGRHYNSMKYGSFSGRFSHPEKKRLELTCQVKTDEGRFVSVPYTLEIYL